MRKSVKRLSNASNPSHDTAISQPDITSQRSKHGFYDEFSVIQTDQNYGSAKDICRRGSKTIFQRFFSALKPGPDQTYKEKYSESCSSCCSKNLVHNLFPVTQWIGSYNLKWLKSDLMAGITVSILLVPQSLAYATLAGLPPEWGLYASVMPIFFYVIWGTSTQIAVGPVAPTAIMVASAVEGVIASFGLNSSDPDYPELYQSIAMTLSFVCGVVLIIFGLIRAGFIIVFLSRPVMIGFIMSAAFIIFINQFRSLLGLDIGRYPLFYETLIAVLTNLNTINWYTALISAISLFILFLPKCCLKGKIPKWVPLPLIVIVFWILVSYFADLESLGVGIVGGDIKSGFPAPIIPDFQYFGDVFASAIVVAIVSYMGSIALAKGFEQKTKETYKQQLSKYNQWCRDNVEVTLDNDHIDITDIVQSGRNPHNSGYNKLSQTPGSPEKDKPKSDHTPPQSTPQRITPDSNPSNTGSHHKFTNINTASHKLKDEGKRRSQETKISAAGSSFTPTLSGKGALIAEADGDGATATPLMGFDKIDKYSMQSSDDTDEEGQQERMNQNGHAALGTTNDAARKTQTEIEIDVDTLELKLDDIQPKTKKMNKKEYAYKQLPNKSIDMTPDQKKELQEALKPPTKPVSLPPIDLSANMEFIAFGICNLLGAFFSSQVISASFSRSALNFEMNAVSQMSSIVQALICLLCLLFLMPLLSPLPKCVLASLVTVSVYRLIKNGVNEFKFLWKVSRIELIEYFVASIAPLVIGLEIGIFLAIGTSLLVNILRHSFASIIYLGRLQSTISDDAEYVDQTLFKQAKPVPHITIIEMKAELAFANNNRLIDKLRVLLAGGNKYIVVSLNLTSFIDTTVIRQIVTIFEDAKGSYICLSQCRPKVIELITRYESESADGNNKFPSNIKTFISTHDAVRYLQSVRSKQLHENEDYITSDEEVEDSLSSLSKPELDNYVTPQIEPVSVRPHGSSGGDHSDGHISPRKRNSSEFTISQLDIAHEKARKHTFSFRGTPRAQNQSYSTQLDSDSEDGTDPEYKHDQPNIKKRNSSTTSTSKNRSSGGSDKSGVSSRNNINLTKINIPRVRWSDIKPNDHGSKASTASVNISDDSDIDPYHRPMEMRIVDSLTQQNISKIDEVNEQEESDKSNEKDKANDNDKNQDQDQQQEQVQNERSDENDT